MRRRTAADCMKMQQPPRRASKRFFAPSRHATWLTLLCVALVLFCGAMQAGHVHDVAFGSADTHAACSLCVTAHVGIQAATPPLLRQAASVVGQVEPTLPDTTFPAPKNFDLFTRPPPNDPTLA